MGRVMQRRLVLAIGLIAAMGEGLCSSDPDSYPADPAYNMAAADTHWAFVPLRKPDAPRLDGAVGNEVDAFIRAKLDERGLAPSDPADKRSLLRRLTFDLTGLPPSYEDVQSFLADDSADAYEKWVERLLDSPEYGERWGRRWLDVARYADTEGRPNFRENRYKYAHTYRDYVIDSFNSDKPYDQFIVEQIAADQLDLDEDKSPLAALGFLTLGNSFFGRKDFIIDDQIDVVTRGIQGLTVTCARCHDHKFDPIPTIDYYSLHGIFNSSEMPDELPIIRYPENEADYQAYLAQLEENKKVVEAKAEEVIDGFLNDQRARVGNFLATVDEAKSISDEEAFEKLAGSNRIAPEMLRLWIEYLDTKDGRSHPVLAEWFDEYAAADREAGVESYNQRFADALDEEKDGFEAERAFLQESCSPLNPERSVVREWVSREIRQKTDPIARKQEVIEWTHPGTPFRAHVIKDVDEPKNSKVYKRGDKNNLGPEAPRQYLEVLSRGERVPYSQGSGRLELARELASPENPLTARVFVNRVWGWHMGREIVDTPSDFGVRTPEPEQIDLLNWLAADFIESGWSIKSLHRRIVLSDAYRRSSDPVADSIAADSENLLWHHVPKRRLDFEAMRDSLLHVSGNLDRTMGGVQEDIANPESNRRTVYSYFDRTDPPGIFRTFDHPSPNATSPGRFETVVPQQALFLMNSGFAIRQARSFAERVATEAGDDAEARIRRSYRLAFQRDATEGEVQTGLDFITSTEGNVAPIAPSVQNTSGDSEDEESEEDAAEPLTNWELYAQVLLQSNELLFVD